jgi:hypothetical protein
VNVSDWIVLLLSLIKLSEAYVLWKMQGLILCCICNVTWLYFFLAAALLQLRYTFKMKARQNREDHDSGTVDILAGDLPTTMRQGGDRKIFLGSSKSDHKSLSWRLTWAIGGIVCTTSLVMTYVYLGYSGNRTVYVWSGFQALWLVTRLTFHHFADAVHQTRPRMITERPWDNISPPLKHRVLELTFALGKYQAYIHPRGHYSYLEDLSSSRKLRDYLSQTDHQLCAALPGKYVPSIDKAVDVSITAVIGDTVLASAAWIVQGSKLTGLDLYDTCVVFINIGGTHFAIPSARVLAGIETTAVKQDIENPRPPQLAPKGVGNTGFDITWWYWIPCEGGRWLQMHSEKMKILGQRRAHVLLDQQVTQRLLVGDLKISLTNVSELKATASLASDVSGILLELLPRTKERVA